MTRYLVDIARFCASGPTKIPRNLHLDQIKYKPQQTHSTCKESHSTTAPPPQHSAAAALRLASASCTTDTRSALSSGCSAAFCSSWLTFRCGCRLLLALRHRYLVQLQCFLCSAAYSLPSAPCRGLLSSCLLRACVLQRRFHVLDSRRHAKSFLAANSP